MNIYEKNGFTESTIIRHRREAECFPVINRGSLWYDSLSSEQKAELKEWYEAWLDAPETLVVPTKPNWI